MMGSKLRGLAVAVFVPLVAACGGDGPKEDVSLGPIDPQLAARGEQLFRSKGCTACHTVGDGRLVGPDLAEVTTRRDYGFVVGMITNPDSMLANDPVAKSMLAEYLTPMADQGVTEAEARALFEYFRQSDADREVGSDGAE